MAIKEPEGTGAVSNDKVGATTIESSAKVEVKDGKVLVDGKSFVAESDLIAAKRSLQKQMEEAQAVHNTAIDQTKLDLSTAQSEVAKANAELNQLKEAHTVGAASTDEVAKAKQEADAAKKALGEAVTASLELRKKLILTAYPNQVTTEQLKDKTPEQLNAFEEALKALTTSRGGPGAYALGGGGSGTTRLTDEDRAKRVLASTPIRGSRTAETK